MKECDWLLLHQIFFCILYFSAFSISTISLHYHKTKLTKRHLASVVKSLENQLIINIPVNLTTAYKVRYKACPEMRVDQEDQNLGNTSQANWLVSRGGGGGSVLPHVGELSFFGHPSSDDFTIKMPYWVSK